MALDFNMILQLYVCLSDNSQTWGLKKIISDFAYECQDSTQISLGKAT